MKLGFTACTNLIVLTECKAYKNCFLLLYKDLYPKFNDRKTVVQTEQQIAIIIDIWYIIAVVGNVPESICPVIIPGKKIIPIPSIEFIVGINAVSKALLANGFNIFFGSTPKLSKVLILSFSLLISSMKVFIAIFTPVIALPIIIPASGIVYWGLEIDLPTTIVTKKIKTKSPENVKEIPIAILKLLFKSFLLVITLCIEKIIIITKKATDRKSVV